MTRTRTLLILVLGGLFLVLGMPVSHAADPVVVPPGCYLYGLPPGQTVVCPSDTPPQVIHSVCTPIDNSAVAPLLRKSCQRFDQDNKPVGDPQIFIYAPEPSSAPATTAPGTSVSPSATPQSASAPVAPVVTPHTITRTSVSDHTVVVREPAVTVTPELTTPPATPTTTEAPRVNAAPPVFDLGGHNAQQSVSDGVLYGIAAVAALVLLGVTVIPALLRRFKGGAHRA